MQKIYCIERGKKEKSSKLKFDAFLIKRYCLLICVLSVAVVMITYVISDPRHAEYSNLTEAR